MERLFLEKLIAWKNSPSRRPLVLEGARQVGKTWLLKQFGATEYKNCVYINCDHNPMMDSLFSDFDIKRILLALSAQTKQQIIPGETLIIFDEIQESPLALTSLKYFCEDAPEYHVAVAGSLLGLQVHSGTGFPVGKVDRLSLNPLSFKEFLLALGENILVEYLDKGKWSEYATLKSKLIQLLREYYYVGGMPLVVDAFSQRHNIFEVRDLQKKILKDYAADFSKHIPKNELPKVRAVWKSIPSQLAKENKKFIWGVLRTGARAKEYENAVQWLLDAGLIHKVTRIKKFDIPLKFYEETDCFKVFLNDLGLLGAMANVPAKEILVDTKMMTEYKGSFTEQFVEQTYRFAQGEPLYYYSNDNSTAEIDFVIQADRVYPIEVKAEENLKAKSLAQALKTNENLHGLRFSMSDYREEERMTNVPLYLAEWFLGKLR
jgi:predicted AAA+ superfamily ATPase